MLDADHLRIVFQVSGVGFVMPVADLLAIQSVTDAELTLLERSSDSLLLGHFPYQNTAVAVYDLAALFELTEAEQCTAGRFLIFSGFDCPWAVRVEQIVGVVAAEALEFLPLPSYMLRDAAVPYQQVALHNGLLLVSVEASQVDQAWPRGE